MTWRGRILHGRQKQLAQSTSLPDVSGAGLPPPLPRLLSSPTKTVAVKYNIDDDAWADKIDPVTGSVFYLDSHPAPPPHREESPQPQSSSSSSMSSISDIPLHSLPTYLPHGSPSLSDRLTQGLRFQQADSPSSPSPDEQFHLPRSASLGQGKTSSLKKLKKVVTKRLRNSISISSGMNPSGSIPSLNELDSQYVRRISEPAMLQVPQTTLYGSHGIPLHDTTKTNVVDVRINLAQFHLGVGGTPCSLEAMGIVPTRSLGRTKFGSLMSLRVSFKSHYPSTAHQHPVVIRGVAPTSPAAVTQQLHPGDIISAVNGNSVDLENIDTILSGLSNEVVFTVRKQFHHLTPGSSPSHLPHGHSCAGLAQLVAGARRTVHSHTKPLLRYTHILLYLTLDTEEGDPPDKDILYRFPSGESWCVDRLAQLRGVFLTLSDILGSVSMATSFCSTVLLDDRLVHLGYIKYGKEVLLLALPAKFASQYQVQLLVKNVERVLQLLYGSVNNACTSPDTHPTLDHLFSLMFDSLLSPPTVGPSSPLPGLPAAPQLKLSTDIKVKLSSALSGLESANHSNRHEILCIRRPFFLTGTCMFYKGALLCSHMCEEDLKDIVMFCSAYRLLELTAAESISQIVIWREVYLTSAQSLLGKRDPVYSESRGRCFLLIIGMEHVLLCMLMEQSHSQSSEQGPPTVDAVYVDRGRALILELKAQDLLAQCEGRGLLSSPLPSLTSADITLASLFSSVSISRKPSQQSIKEGSGSDEGEVHTSHGSPKSGKHGRRHSSIQQSFKPRRTDLPPPNNLWRRHGVFPVRPAYMLTSGLENTLLHYVALHPGHGVMVCPTHATPPGPVHAELVQSFRQASVAVREVLRGKVEGGRVREEEEEEDSDSESDEEHENKTASPPFSLSRGSVIEHGVMLQCCTQHHTQDRQKTLPVMNYWIVGRLFPASTNLELYVCYQENMSQNIVEMAFTLLFGWPG